MLAYVHNNPVRAGVVTDPTESRWTSHRAYVGEEAAPGWLDVREGLRLAGFDESREGRAGFDEVVRARSERGRDAELSGRDGQRNRRLLRGALGATVELASPALGGAVGVGVEHVVHAGEGARLRCRWPGSMEALVRRVAAAAGVPAKEIGGWNRRRPVVRARRLVVMVAVGHLGRTLTEVAAVVGVSVQSASRLLHRGGGDRPALLREARAIGDACWAGTVSAFHLSSSTGPEALTDRVGTVSAFHVPAIARDQPEEGEKVKPSLVSSDNVKR